jgi:hypothetical protein
MTISNEAMSKRVIYLSGYNHPDPRIMAWIEANGLDPHRIPVNAPVFIEDGQITVTEFVLEQTVPGAPPHKTLTDDGWKSVQRAAPLLSSPEDHGLYPPFEGPRK